MDDLLPFESPKILIDGAKQGISDLESGCSRFIENCTHNVVTYEDRKSGEQVICLRFKERIPGNIRYLGYGIACDLRHALDHAFGDAAILLGRTNAKNLYFPFGRSAADTRRSGEMEKLYVL